MADSLDRMLLPGGKRLAPGRPQARMTMLAAPALVLLATCAIPAAAAPSAATRFDGPCDASAAIALDAGHFVVGNDEDDTLHIYRFGQPAAVRSVDLKSFLATAPREESDIEGAAAVGKRIYWITSHGRNAKGKHQPSRHRLFATDVLPGNPPVLFPVGRPYTTLLDDMLAAAPLAPYGLASAAQRAAEAEGGLNIEGLAATPEGTLLIGLRNPVPRGRALIVPLLNPDRLIEGERARFGTPVELDLGQRGIRSIERIGNSYLIVAGPPADTGSFALYRWTGVPGDPARQVPGADLGDLRPEALFAIPGSGHIQLLSDDGGIRIGGVECKKLPSGRQQFRGLTVEVTP